jgi:hypothetical protein
MALLVPKAKYVKPLSRKLQDLEERFYGVEGLMEPTTITITQVLGTTNTCEVDFQCYDKAHVAMTYPCMLVVWCCDAATGIGLWSGTAISGTPAAATGTIMGIATAKKCWIVRTTAAGAFALTILDTNKGLHYWAAAPLWGPGTPQVSAIMSVSLYG